MKLNTKSASLFFAIALLAGFAAGAEPDAALKPGDKAPLFTGRDEDGKKWKLADELGRGMVLLYFYPKDNTPGCTAEACGLRDKLGDLNSRGVKVVGVSFDSEDSHKKFIFMNELNFTLLADTKGKIADAYGARMAGGKKMARRISFLIGADGTILHITDSPNPAVHLSEMQDAIRTAKAPAAK